MEFTAVAICLRPVEPRVVGDVEQLFDRYIGDPVIDFDRDSGRPCDGTA